MYVRDKSCFELKVTSESMGLLPLTTESRAKNTQHSYQVLNSEFYHSHVCSDTQSADAISIESRSWQIVWITKDRSWTFSVYKLFLDLVISILICLKYNCMSVSCFLHSHIMISNISIKPLKIISNLYLKNKCFYSFQIYQWWKWWSYCVLWIFHQNDSLRINIFLVQWKTIETIFALR